MADNHGGRRPGAGRKPGSRTRRTQEIVAEAAENGQSPVEYMLSIMRDPTVAPARRDYMATAAAPYIHARLGLLAVSGPEGGAIDHRINFAERQREARAAIDAAFEEHEPKMSAAVPPAIEPRRAEGETLPLPRDFAQDGEAEPAPVPLPVRHRAPRAVGGWGG